MAAGDVRRAQSPKKRKKSLIAMPSRPMERCEKRVGGHNPPYLYGFSIDGDANAGPRVMHAWKINGGYGIGRSLSGPLLNFLSIDESEE